MAYSALHFGYKFRDGRGMSEGGTNCEACLHPQLRVYRMSLNSKRPDERNDHVLPVPRRHTVVVLALDKLCRFEKHRIWSRVAPVCRLTAPIPSSQTRIA